MGLGGGSASSSTGVSSGLSTSQPGSDFFQNSNPLNPALVRTPNTFNFVQQQDPETYNKVQAEKQQAQQVQSNRLSELQRVYDQAQGQGATQAIQQQAQNRPVDTLTDPATEPYLGIGNNVAVGLNKAYEGLLKIPRFVYSAAAVPQNFLADKLDMPELGAKYENFLEMTNSTPVTSPLTMLDQLGDYYGEEAEGYATKTQKYDDNIIGSIGKGNFKQAGSQILDQIAESAPSIAVMAMTSGIGNTAELGQVSKTLANALPFMSQRNAELQDDNSVPEWLKPINAAANGLAEVVFDQSFGTQAAIQGIVNRFQSEGREAAVNAAQELTGSFLNGALKSVAAIKPFAKGAIEEASTQLAQNIVDKYTINPDKDLMEGVADAAIVGSAMTGGITTAGNIGLPAQRTQVRELETQNQALLNELGNENLSTQAVDGISKILDTNQASIESIAKETQDAIAKLNPTQKKEVEGINENITAAEAIVNDPNASEAIKTVAEQQIETLTKEAEAIKPEPATKEAPKATESPKPIETTTEVKETVTEPKKESNEVKQPEVTTEKVVEEDLSQKRNEEVLTKAEDDLKALKQVTDKVKKYDASMKRLTEAKNNKEISTTEFNDLKKRFDDVIGDSKPKVKEEVVEAPVVEDVGIPDSEVALQDNENAIPDNTTPVEKESLVKAGDPLRAFATRVREGKINKLGGFKAATGFDAAWDLGLEAVATTIEGGAKIADGIESGLKAIKKTDWYKNLTDKEDFDTKYREHMQNEYGTEEKKATALKNKDIAEKREELGLEQREKVPVLKNTTLVEQANAKIKDGYDTEQLIDDVLDGKREAKADEVIILKEYQLAKEQELVDINDQIVKATEEGKGTPLDRLIDQRELVIQDIDRAYQAGERTGTVSARALQARKVALVNDYSLANMLIEKRKANGGEKLSAEQIDQTVEDYNKIKKLNEEFSKKIEKLTQENEDLKANKAIKSLKSIVEYEERKMGRVAQRESIDKDISDALESLSKKVKAQAGKLSMNAIPVDLIPDLAKLAKLYTKKGINTMEGIVDAMYTNLKNDIEGLTKEELKDVLINYDYDADAKQESRLKAFKNRTQARINELRGRVDRNDFARRRIEPIQLDAEALNLQKELREAKFAWDLGLEKDNLARRTRLEKARDIMTEVLNLPRALMASVDYSAPLRQGIVLGVNNPKIASKAFVEMFRQSWSQPRFDKWLADLKESPMGSVIKESGLYIADNSRAPLVAREEAFMSNWAEKIPLLGRLIKGSERAYVGYLNKLRADVFTQAVYEFENEGKTIENSKPLYEAMASYINSATGRGSLGKLENSAQILNSAFFSPRLIASRVNLLIPTFLFNAPKEVRVQYLKDMTRFIAFGTTVLALASAGGADVEDDPRSSDFGKIRVGDKRWDIWGGFQQFVRFFTQVVSAQRKSTADKAIREIDGKGFKGETRADLMLNMIRSKLAPVPAMGWNLAAGRTLIGEEYTWKDVPKSFLPLFASDLYNATAKEGASGLITTGLPGVFGVSVQDYAKASDTGKPLTEKEMREKIKEALNELEKNKNKNK